MKHKSIPVPSFKVCEGEPEGTGEMIVNVFNVLDSYNERSRIGCFKKSIARKQPKGVWAHDWTRPVAKTLISEELKPGDSRLPETIKDQGGLYIKAAFNMAVQDGRDAFEHLKFGSIDEFSIGYYEVEVSKAKDGSYDLLELDLVEWSPVLKGACPETAMLSMKDAQRAPRRIKSQYLGYYAESSAMIAAVYSLCDSLFWHALYNAFYDDLDEGETVDDVIAHLTGAFDEFRDLSISIMRAIMSGDAGAEAKDAAAATIRARTIDPESQPGTALAAGSFKTQVEAAHAAVKACIERGTAIKAIRAKDTRTLSSERLSELLALKDSLTALLTETIENDFESERLQIEAESLRIQARLRPNFTATSQ